LRFRFALSLLFLLASLWTRAQRPDVVLISLDTFRADRMAAYGGTPALTPSLNALATKGVTFSTCFTPVPITLPAHATLLTGCDPARTTLHDNGRGHLAKELPNLAESFKAAGYDTKAVLASVVLEGRYGLEVGFSSYDDKVGPTLRRNADEVTDKALAALKGAKTPIFLWVHYYDCHEEYEPPEPYASRYPKSPYDGAAGYMDAEIGRLLKALRPSTLVAVTADHGESLGEHGEETHGILLFQPTMKVPLVLYGPGVPGGKNLPVPCSLADVAPTLARLAGVSLVGKPDGRDLGPAMRGGAVPARPLPLESWLSYDEFRWHPLVGTTDGRWKWIRGRALRLFDLARDPGETRDLASNAPGEALALKGSLAPPPSRAAESGTIDESIRGLGYSPVPSSGGSLKNCPDPHDRVTVLKEFDEARRLRGKGHEDRALALFTKAAQSDSGNPTLWFEIGETQRRKGKVEEAGKALDKAVAIAPKMAAAWTSRGHVWLALGKADPAAACYEKALRINPNMIEALNPMAARYFDLNQPEKALPLLDRAIKGEFANSDTYLMQGRITLVRGKPDRAKKDFDRAMALSRNGAMTLKAVADIYTVQDMRTEGLRLYQEGIRRFPDYAPNYLTIGNLFLQANEPEKALPLFRKALVLDLSPEDRKTVREIVSGLEKALGAAGK
jgi:tetratricopeptide (TPR) repeat protein